MSMFDDQRVVQHADISTDVHPSSSGDHIVTTFCGGVSRYYDIPQLHVTKISYLLTGMQVQVPNPNRQ